MAAWRIFEFCIDIFYSLSDICIDLLDWLDTTTIFGDTYGELIFGSAVTILLGYAAIKFIVDIWPG